MTWRDWTQEHWDAIDFAVGMYTENIEDEVGEVDDTTEPLPDGLVSRQMDSFDYDQLRAFAYDLHEASYNHDHEAFAERMEGNGPGWIANAAWVFLNPVVPGMELLGENCEVLLAALEVAGIEP